MANGTVARATETVEILPPKVAVKAVNKDGDVKVEVKQGSTQEVKSVYLSADGVFSDIPEVIADMVTQMTKDKFSKILIASGTPTEAQLNGLRLNWLIEKVSSLYKSWETANEKSALDQARKHYQDFRRRGFSKEEASQLANYNPLD